MLRAPALACGPVGAWRAPLVVVPRKARVAAALRSVRAARRRRRIRRAALMVPPTLTKVIRCALRALVERDNCAISVFSGWARNASIFGRLANIVLALTLGATQTVADIIAPGARLVSFARALLAVRQPVCAGQGTVCAFGAFRARSCRGLPCSCRESPSTAGLAGVTAAGRGSGAERPGAASLACRRGVRPRCVAIRPGWTVGAVARQNRAEFRLKLAGRALLAGVGTAGAETGQKRARWAGCARRRQNPAQAKRAGGAGTQAELVSAPCTGCRFPAGHASQVLDEVAAVAVLKVPAAHGVHASTDVAAIWLENVPAAQGWHAVSAVVAPRLTP